MRAHHEDVIKVADKVEKLEARINAAPSKRIRVDPQGAPATGLQNLTEVTQQLDLLQDQLGVNSGVQNELLTQVQELEDWKECTIDVSSV